jgi:hypothetical protein
LLESMPLLETAFVRLNDDCGDTCDVTDPRLQNCGNQDCQGCYGYPVGHCRSVLLNGLSNAIHLEFIAHSKVVSIYLLPSLIVVFFVKWFLITVHLLMCIKYKHILKQVAYLQYHALVMSYVVLHLPHKRCLRFGCIRHYFKFRQI